MRIPYCKLLWAREGKDTGQMPARRHEREEPHRTVVSVGKGPDTMHGGGGGSFEIDAEPTLPDQATEDEQELFKGPQDENA